MYGEILKYGSYIVDALVEYKQPVFVYIPPYGELRGGAWVVVDPKINPDVMEMFADKDSRGGVLEPEGTVTVQFKHRDIISTMQRTDPIYNDLFTKAKDDSDSISNEEKKKRALDLKNREAYLLPSYHMISTTFADLHDTPQRMVAKGVIQEILEWKTAREFMYWKVRRRMLEAEVEGRIKSANKKLNHGQMQSMVRRWFIEAKGPVQNYLWDNNEAVVDWLSNTEEQQTVNEHIKMIQKDALIQKIDTIASGNDDVSLEAVIGLLQKMSPRQQDEIRKMLDSNSAKESDHEIAEE